MDEWTICGVIVRGQMNFGQSLCAKINVAGPSVADFWDVDNKQTPPPPDFKSVCFNAMCQVRGVYMVKASMLLFD